ncbi:PACE efflux transporter [Amaricoccus solimangrovi]|uniref:PACE efflux transporter n=1 Tax=Amaricoccus solimangrovi TaxID=2589815 RepID=A0A501WWK6_9RHOB|nr:PACE efflux transporter [Amaricoccus solimangrovi]TPE52635.1 PACE efflux transporter [Amaricoccus solimangrovi]
MQGIRRRVVYLTLYEALAIALSSSGLAVLFGIHVTEAGSMAVTASVIAVLWNLAYNAGFEAWERRRTTKGRSLALRVGHAVGFEFGLTLALVPLFALMLGISLVEAFVLDLGMIVFFLFYTFLFNLGFDRVFGLPLSAREIRTEACEAGGSPLARAG